MAHELLKRIDGTSGNVCDGSLLGNSLTATPPPYPRPSLTPMESDEPEQLFQMPWLTSTELDALQQQTEQNNVRIQRAEDVIGSLQQQFRDCISISGRMAVEVTACQSGLAELQQRCGDVEAVLRSTNVEAEVGRALQLGEVLIESNRSLASTEQRRRSTSTGDGHVEVQRSQPPKDGCESGVAAHSLDLGELERWVSKQVADLGELERMMSSQIGELGAAQAGGFHRCDTALTAVQQRIESLEKSCSPAVSELATVQMRLASLERRAILMSPRSPTALSDEQAREELPGPLHDALTNGLNEALDSLRQELEPRVAAAEATCSGGLRHVRGLAAGCAAQLEAMQGEVHRIVKRLSALETPSTSASGPLVMSARGPLSARQDSESVSTAGPVCKAKEEDLHEMPDQLSSTNELVDAAALSTTPVVAGGPCGTSGQVKLHVQPQANSTNATGGCASPMMANSINTTSGCASPMVAWRRFQMTGQDPPHLSPALWPQPWPVPPQAPQQRRTSPIRSTAPQRESSCPIRLPPSQNLGVRRLSSQQEKSSQQRDSSPMQALPPPTQIQVEPLSARGSCRDGGQFPLQRHAEMSPRPIRPHVPAATQGSHYLTARDPWVMCGMLHQGGSVATLPAKAVAMAGAWSGNCAMAV